MPAIKKMDRAKKTMIYLDWVDHAALKHRAKEQGVSMSDLLRLAVKRYLARAPKGKAVRK